LDERSASVDEFLIAGLNRTTLLEANLSHFEPYSIDADIARVQSSPPTLVQSIVSFMQFRMWPIILVLALALKFAKGIAGLQASLA